MSSTLQLTRNDLAKFLPDLRSIRAFETLLQTPAEINNNAAEISTLNSEVASINADIATIDSQIAAINSEIVTLEDSINLVSSDLATLTTYVYANVPADYGTY